MSDFDHHWITHKVKERTQVPDAPHYQALVFGTRREYHAPWDKDDVATYSSVFNIDVYVFKDRSDLEMFVSDATRNNIKFVFFYVRELGKSSVNISIDVA